MASMMFICFDIETTGLDPLRDEVTMICSQDLHAGTRRSYNFGILNSQEQSVDGLLEELVTEFDAADCLCAFNGIRFDLPFMQQALGLPTDVITRWVLKTVDPLEFLRLSGQFTTSLDKICIHNNIVSKSSTGLRAIQMAHEGLWEELEEYCQQDVSILCVLVKQRTFNHPTQGVLVDLIECTPDGTYT